jgi:hypothetical protein
MAQDTENFNKELYNLLKVRGYGPVPLDNKNQRVPASQAADVMQFTFIKDGEDYGKVWLTIDDAKNVIVYYDEEQQKSPSGKTPGVDYDDSWTGFLKHVKTWAQRRQLSFELLNKDRLSDDMRQRDYYKMKEKLGEDKKLKEIGDTPAGRKALGSYIKKSSSDLEDAAYDTGFASGEGGYLNDKRRRQKRPQGIDRAVDRLVKEGKIDHFGYEIKGNKKPWGLYHTKPNKSEKLVSKHHNKNAAEAAKRDQLGMGACVKGEKFTVKKILAPELAEGYYPMGKKASYNDAVPNVKIVIQHSRTIEEGEQRYRNVAKIYLENVDGERFLAPTNRPGVARVYARHIAEGGVPNDDRWNHIKSICEDYTKMAGFVRATRNGQFNESAQELVTEGVNHYNNLRETLSKMTGHRGYQAYFESWTPTLMENEGDESINELFVQETMDPRIESAMPILSRLRKPVVEMSEVDTLAEWADTIISEKLDMDSTTKTIAVKKLTKEEAGDDELLIVIKKKLSDEGGAAAFKPLKDAATKIGINLTPQMLKNMPGVSQHDDGDYILKEELDLEEGDVDENFISMAPQAVAEEEVEESALQAYLGKKKYGKKGMKALQQAGRAGASKEKMANIRAKHDKLDEEDMAEGKSSAKKPTFKRIDDYAVWNDDYVMRIGAEYEETEIDGKLIGVAWTNNGVRGLWYNKARVGSFSSIPFEDEMAYSESDPNYPYANDHVDDVYEDLDANQKRVGQLGPTEKVKDTNIGKLVGANESAEIPEELARIMEMARFKR